MEEPVKRKKSSVRCFICNKPLWMEEQEDGKFKTIAVMSMHTGNRYCFPGTGCFK